MNESLADRTEEARKRTSSSHAAPSELPATGVELKLDGAVAKLSIGSGPAQTEIEISPAGYVRGEYFVATFDGARIGALVRLNDRYERVSETDLKLMVGVERDVSAYPSIRLVGGSGQRRVRIVARGLETRVALEPFCHE